MSFGPHPRHTRYRKSAGEELSARLRAWREKNDFSQSEAALRLQISKRTLQEWEQERAEPRGLASAAIEKTIREYHSRLVSVQTHAIREHLEQSPLESDRRRILQTH